MTIVFPWNKYFYHFFIKYLTLRKFISIPVLFFSYWVFIKSVGDIRYSGFSIADQGGLAQLILIIKTIIFFDLTAFLVSKDRISFSKYYNKSTPNYLMLVSHFLLLGGNWDALFGIIVIGKMFFENLFNYFFYYDQRLSKTLLKYFLVLLLIFPILSIILFLGMSIKRDYNLLDVDIMMLAESYGSFKLFFLYLIESFSSHYHSMNYSLANYPDFNPNIFLNLIKIPLESFWYRMNLIFGNAGELSGVGRPFVSGLSQFNFFQLTGNYQDLRQGTSPGLISSSIFLFGKNFGFFLSISYFLFLSRIIDHLMITSKDNHYSLIGTFLMLLIFIFLFQSPIDFLNIVDNGSILFLLIFALSSALKYEKIIRSDN